MFRSADAIKLNRYFNHTCPQFYPERRALPGRADQKSVGSLFSSFRIDDSIHGGHHVVTKAPEGSAASCLDR